MKIPITDIKVKEEVLNDAEIQSIAQSFTDQGQLHPIAVHQVNGYYTLITGRKRLAAATLIGFSTIECSVYENLSPDQQEEIVLHENLKRFDLPWFEQVVLTERLHALQQKLHGKPPEQGGGRVKVGWSVRDTAA